MAKSQPSRKEQGKQTEGEISNKDNKARMLEATHHTTDSNYVTFLERENCADNNKVSNFQGLGSRGKEATRHFQGSETLL